MLAAAVRAGGIGMGQVWPMVGGGARGRELSYHRVMAQTRTFPVVLVPQSEGGYFIQCPTLPGCYSQGETVEEALANIREAIELVVEDMQAQGQAIPSAGPTIMTEVTVAA